MITARYWSIPTNKVESKEREATAWLTIWDTKHCSWYRLVLVDRSKATRGRRSREEARFTTSRFITNRLEVVRRLRFLKNTTSRQTFIVTEARKSTASRTSNRQMNASIPRGLSHMLSHRSSSNRFAQEENSLKFPHILAGGKSGESESEFSSSQLGSLQPTEGFSLEKHPQVAAAAASAPLIPRPIN